LNKKVIKNFAIWARNKLIADITYKAGLLGITEKEIKSPLSQSTRDVQFFDFGTREPYSITGVEIKQRSKLVEIIQQKEKQSDYKTAYKGVIEEVAYTWFNRLIAVRFMEVNDYLPPRVRVLSSENGAKIEPDLVTSPFDADLDYSPYEEDRIMQLKNDNQLDKLFCMLFIKQCNLLNAILPELFEKTHDYTELLMNVSFTDKDGVVYHLVHDIPEDDFNVEKEGQVEIIGWLYQYYNTELKDETFALLKKNVKITKERIPAATQLFTPDWIVRYMVENSLGRLWLEGHPNGVLKSEWKYYLDEAEQELEVQAQLDKIREGYKAIKPEDIKIIDPCMGSGHILVYAFDVLMQIYESYGYSQRDAAKNILENNLYGLDIDNRAYQLAYFAVMMKARQYSRRILNGKTKCNLYAIQESNFIDDDLIDFIANSDAKIRADLQSIRNDLHDAKEYGSILRITPVDFASLIKRIVEIWSIFYDDMFEQQLQYITVEKMLPLIKQAYVMLQQYDVVVTNPPYMGSSGMSGKLADFVKEYYPDSKSDLFAVFIERCNEMTKNNGYQAMITQYVWMYKTVYADFRKKMLEHQLVNMVHLGANAFDEINGEVVQTTTFVLTKIVIANYISSFMRLIDYPNEEIKRSAFYTTEQRYLIKQDRFSIVAEYIFAYWINDNIFDILINAPTLAALAAPRKGLTTGDNDRFVRLWHEISISSFSIFNAYQKWFPMTKGGLFRKWYGNNDYVVNWENDGREIRNFKDEKRKLRSRPQNIQYYFREGISWNDTASGDIAFRYQTNNYIPNASGPCVYSDDIDIRYWMGMLNSKVSRAFLEVLAPALKFEVGQVARFPTIFDPLKSELIIQNVASCIDLSKQDWDSFEISWDFKKHPLIQYKMPHAIWGNVTSENIQANGSIAASYKLWKGNAEARFLTLMKNEEELNRIFIEIYGLQDELTPEIDNKDVTVARIYDFKEDIPESMKGNNYVLTKSDVIKSLISYAVGCMFGRYSLDVDGLAYAGGEWDDSKYSTFIPDKDDILPITDEEYFENDVVGLFCAFLQKTFSKETLEENLDFIAKALGNKGNSSREIIRNYLLKDFFKDHCKIYQKRPIYWLFDSGKANGFKVLIYMHRYNEDTIGNLRIDYLHRMQRVYESEISRMQETIENSTNAREVTAAQKRKEKLTKQLKETKEYDEKIAHLALARIAIDLDDGVKVNYEKVQTGTDGKKFQVLAKI